LEVTVKAAAFLYDAKGAPFAVYVAEDLAECEAWAADWAAPVSYYDPTLSIDPEPGGAPGFPTGLGVPRRVAE
jgi:hypothetical protein